MVRIAEAGPSVMVIEDVALAGLVWRVKEKEVGLGAFGDRLLEIAAAQDSPFEPAGEILGRLPADLPPPVLAAVPHVSLGARVVSPHALEAGAVQVERACGLAR